jgi:hypothetical protein
VTLHVLHTKHIVPGHGCCCVKRFSALGSYSMLAITPEASMLCGDINTPKLFCSTSRAVCVQYVAPDQAHSAAHRQAVKPRVW